MEAIVILVNFATTLEQVVASTKVRHVVIASMGDLLGGAKGSMAGILVAEQFLATFNWSLGAAMAVTAAAQFGTGFIALLDEKIVFGIVTVFALGWLLIHVINKQSFGWTLAFAVPVARMTVMSRFAGRRVRTTSSKKDAGPKANSN